MGDIDEYKKKFSEKGQKILDKAIAESYFRETNYVSVELITYVIILEQRDVFLEILNEISVEIDELISTIEKHIDDSSIYEGVGFKISPETTNLFKRSMDYARSRNRKVITSFDMLNTLLKDEKSILNTTLVKLGANQEEISAKFPKYINKIQRKRAVENLPLIKQKEHTKSNIENVTKFNSKKVFIVHGHDELATQKVARFLEKLELEPVILHEQASRNRTIIEKLEHYSDVAFAVVLLTPDDVGAVASEKDNLKPRARQNVILELGYMMAKLGRHNVCALLKDSVEKPSDYDGVTYISMDTGGAWKQELVRELKDAGINGNFPKLYS